MWYSLFVSLPKGFSTYQFLMDEIEELLQSDSLEVTLLSLLKESYLTFIIFFIL